jgi:spore coat polysaccharide biosynthesis protein SpsF
VVVQARMTSTRLPGKVLADLEGEPALHILLKRLRRARELQGVVVATSTDPTDDPVAAAARQVGVTAFRGPLEDVLARYALVARALEPAAVVRITADCPLIDPDVVDRVVGRWRHGDESYVANVIPPRSFPVGMDTEVIDTPALLAADEEADRSYDREHVTPFVRDRPDRFPQAAVRLQPPRDAARLTLDTADDLDRLRRLVAAAGPDASMEELLAALEA